MRSVDIANGYKSKLGVQTDSSWGRQDIAMPVISIHVFTNVLHEQRAESLSLILRVDGHDCYP